MTRVIGVDIGNSSTEVALADVTDNGEVTFINSGIAETTGIKGTKQNLIGVRNSINQVLEKAHMAISDVDLIRINEATPVIGDVAMETITETVITESTMPTGYSCTGAGNLRRVRSTLKRPLNGKQRITPIQPVVLLTITWD